MVKSVYGALILLLALAGRVTFHNELKFSAPSPLHKNDGDKTLFGVARISIITTREAHTMWLVHSKC